MSDLVTDLHSEMINSVAPNYSINYEAEALASFDASGDDLCARTWADSQCFSVVVLWLHFMITSNLKGMCFNPEPQRAFGVDQKFHLCYNYI